MQWTRPYIVMQYQNAQRGEAMALEGGPKSPQEANAQAQAVNNPKNNGDQMSDYADLDYGFKRVKYGDIVAGTIVRVEPREILIDIGAKSEGIVASKELETMSAEALKKIH